MGIDAVKVNSILQRVRENTETECINIRTRIRDGRLPLTSSKFGGFPYWPKNCSRPYPHTSDGRKLPLTLLAQINLSDLPDNDVFPDKGILQFYILNGADTKNYEVVLHKEIEEPIVFTHSGPLVPTSLMPAKTELTRESGRKITVPNLFWGGEGFPVTGELALEFFKGYDFANPTENCFEAEFMRAGGQVGVHIPEDFNIYTELPNEFYNKFYESCGGHKLLGRPCFVQNDYREDEDKDDILLFQMDSAWPDSGETDRYNFIKLGDAGCAGFFIGKEDLKNLVFSNVYYQWECL